jgi:hypothetical protein
MNPSNKFRALKDRALLACALLAAGAFLCPVPGFVAAAAVATLPATPVGELGAQLIHHINTDSPAQMQQWAPGVLSASVPQDDKADFLANLASAARDSGGVDLFNVRGDPHQPALLQMVVKTRRSGHWRRRTSRPWTIRRCTPTGRKRMCRTPSWPG